MLYFADRERTEVVVCELLMGLNYICRYEQQQNALLGCSSSLGDRSDCVQPFLALTRSHRRTRIPMDSDGTISCCFFPQEPPPWKVPLLLPRSRRAGTHSSRHSSLLPTRCRH